MAAEAGAILTENISRQPTGDWRPGGPKGSSVLLGWGRLPGLAPKLLARPVQAGIFAAPSGAYGQVAERLKAHAWKVCNG